MIINPIFLLLLNIYQLTGAETIKKKKTIAFSHMQVLCIHRRFMPMLSVWECTNQCVEIS